jgi:translation initiation factor RLI1
MGKLCIEVNPTDKKAFLSEDLCIGCGICVKKYVSHFLHLDPYDAHVMLSLVTSCLQVPVRRHSDFQLAHKSRLSGDSPIHCKLVQAA